MATPYIASSGSGAGVGGLSDGPTKTGEDSRSPDAGSFSRPRRGGGVSNMWLYVKTGKTTSDEFEIFPNRPLYIGREKVRQLILASYPNARFYSPRSPEQQALLTSRQAHCVFEYIESTDPRVEEKGFFIRVIPRSDGTAPTNPLWILKRSQDGQAKPHWVQIAFTSTPIRLHEHQRYCIGGQFHFEVGDIHLQVTAAADTHVEGGRTRERTAFNPARPARLLRWLDVKVTRPELAPNLYHGELLSKPALLHTRCRKGLESDGGGLVMLRHENVVQVIGMTKDTAVGDESLGTVLLSHPPTTPDGRTSFELLHMWTAPSDALMFCRAVIKMLLQLSKGFQYIHKMGWAHGSIDDGSVIVTPDIRGFVAHITNFSRARPAPEYSSGRPAPGVPAARPGSRSDDVYAFGVLIVQAFLTYRQRDERTTAENLTELQKVRAKLEKSVDPTPLLHGDVRGVMRELSFPLPMLVESCLHRDVSRRPTFDELRAELRRWTHY